MIFADKLIDLRKKAGWSQEELAEQMQVSRQSISKWEGAQSVPDLEKILRLSALFNVSTDYLLKDELEAPKEEPIPTDTPTLKKVTLEEASAFLAVKKRTADFVAGGVFLCILSVLWVIVLSMLGESGQYSWSEDKGAGVGCIFMLMQVAAAVALFLYSGSKTAEYGYLSKEPFETAYGVSGLVKERRTAYQSTYQQSNLFGVVLCILSVVPPIVAGIFFEGSVSLMAAMLVCMFFMCGVGVVLFVRAGIVWGSFQRLLQEGDYTPTSKKLGRYYWPIVTALYLGYSFLTNRWATSWIIWPIAAVLCPVLFPFIDRHTK